MGEPPPKPILKWVGGKSQILAEVLADFPTEMQSYHEPFLGGGSVLLEVLHRRSRDALTIRGEVYASDINPNLIGLYQNVQARPQELLAELERISAEFSECPADPPSGAQKTALRKPKSITEAMVCRESYYYWSRARFNAMVPEDRTSPRGSALLVFLNRTCFRGVYREGPKGFNVPYGNYKNPTLVDADNLLRVSALIADVVFTCCPYAEALAPEKLQKGDFIYLDPPYAPENQTSFVGYTAQGFGPDDHTALFALAQRLPSDHHVGVLMSNADVPMVREAFTGPEKAFRLRTLSCRRAIHSKKPETRTNELLILGEAGCP